MPSRVLVIDDDELSRDVFALVLSQGGHTVDTADSGDAAILRLKGTSFRPEVILTDLQMPGTTGSELARQLRSLCGPSTILLAMSATAPEDGSENAFNGLLLKPFTAETFANALSGQIPLVGEESSTARAVDLEETVFQKLFNSMRPDKLEKLYEMCLVDAEKRLMAMHDAVSRDDEPTFKKEAHAIKGSCGMVGACELQTLATSMEKHGFRNDDHVASLQQFMLAHRRLRGMLVARKVIHNQVGSVSGENA
ncbi:MAG TPA: response regulator [Edaphobacter sp.]|jgi:CheY-like chemotaxis protein|nr:response regulator [Edaphobacter sp.]